MIHKEDMRRCALEEITSNLLFSLIVFSLCSLCAICFTRNKFHAYGKDIFAQRGLEALRFRENILKKTI